MLYYIVTKGHAHTLQNWIEHYHALLLGRVRILPYSRCHGDVRAGTFIFSDVERLSPRETCRASKLWEILSLADCNMLNHPAESLRRYSLQKALRNDFRVFRRDEVPDDIQYPVFLRNENDHKGSLTELLHDHRSYLAARREFPDALLVEYLDTRGEDGCFRKYSAVRIGDHLIPRHVMFSRSWVVKENDVVTDATVGEELTYFEDNPHEVELREIFRTAKIDFGRIDYSLHEGRIQTWEINSNPTLTSPRRAKASECYEQRGEIHRRSASAINDALLEQAVEQGSGRVRLGFPRTLRPESRFVI